MLTSPCPHYAHESHAVTVSMRGCRLKKQQQICIQRHAWSRQHLIRPVISLDDQLHRVQEVGGVLSLAVYVQCRQNIVVAYTRDSVYHNIVWCVCMYVCVCVCVCVWSLCIYLELLYTTLQCLCVITLFLFFVILYQQSTMNTVSKQFIKYSILFKLTCRGPEGPYMWMNLRIIIHEGITSTSNTVGSVINLFH